MKPLSLLIALMLLSALLCSCGEKQPDAAPRLFSQVTSVDKLVLARMTISKMATVSDDNKGRGGASLRDIAGDVADAMKVGSRVAAYSYDTYLRAYIDLSEMRPDDVTVDEKSKTVTLLLPPIRTEFAGRDSGIREDHYRVTGLRSAIDARERASLKERMNESLRKEVEEDPQFTERLTRAARAKCIAYISALMERDGYRAIVEFRGDRPAEIS